MDILIVALLGLLIVIAIVILCILLKTNKKDYISKVIEVNLKDIRNEVINVKVDLNNSLSKIINDSFKELIKENFNNKEENLKLINSQLLLIKDNIETKLEIEFRRVKESFKENNETLLKISNQFKDSEKVINETISKNLENINKKVEERLNEGFKETNKTFMNIIERLSKIDEAQKKIESLTNNIVSLQDILNDKKARGTFGEVQLSVILNSSFGENNVKVFELQKKLSNDYIVDAYLHMPEPNGNISIDSKFPLENYRIMKDKDSSEEKVLMATRLFKQDIKKHIDDISSKYIIEGETSEQAIMFVPSEAVFAEINAYYDELVDYANKKRVLITSPTTLMALLKVIMVVHKDSELNKNTKILFKELEILGKDFKLYSKRWESLQKDIDKVTQDVKEINTTTNKLSNKFDKIQNGKIGYLIEEETVE